MDDLVLFQTSQRTSQGEQPQTYVRYKGANGKSNVQGGPDLKGTQAYPDGLLGCCARRWGAGKGSVALAWSSGSTIQGLVQH